MGGLLTLKTSSGALGVSENKPEDSNNYKPFDQCSRDRERRGSQNQRISDLIVILALKSRQEPFSTEITYPTAVGFMFIRVERPIFEVDASVFW